MCLHMSSMTRAVACKRISLEKKMICKRVYNHIHKIWYESEMIVLSQLETEQSGRSLFDGDSYYVTGLIHC